MTPGAIDGARGRTWDGAGDTLDEVTKRAFLAELAAIDEDLDHRPRRCGCCLAPRNGLCTRCGGPACVECDRCYGCQQVLCAACDTRPTPAFAYPGDRYRHPHNDGPLTELGPGPAGAAPRDPADAT